MGQQALQGPPAGVLLCYSAYQALKWPSSLGSFSVLRGGEGCSAGFTDSAVSPGLHGRWPFVHRDLPRVSSGHLPSLTQRYRLASMAAGLSSTVISLVSPQAISLQSGADSSQPPCAPGDLHPCPGYVGLQQGLSVWFSLHSDDHRSAVALPSSLRCLPCVPNSCPVVGI